MKHIATAVALLLAGAGAALAEPLEGMWQTSPDDNGHVGWVEVTTCGATLCGKLVKAFDSDGRPIESDNIGRKIISRTEPAGDGRYTGRVYSPDRDKTYRSKLELSGDRLSVSGCVMGGLICRDGGTWVRVE
ncbi:DUF2147 domain-containing protein [Roseovarius salinarum]|uniref:DUF2147 domain-containing protein n=1 Tax=Roseovarius salinarum TaxID=1981892 RepID=UPI000C346F23|nr:DUF2147 domain-containing protein [Roseovarius salinarum]